MNKQLWMTALVAFGVTALTIGAYELLLDKDEQVVRIEHVDGTPAKGVMYAADENGELVPLDFTGTAEKVVNAVVHIKSTITFRADEDPMARMPEFFDPFREFFGDPHGDSPFGPFFRFERPRGQKGPQVRVGTGSGVIISEDGYIVTNNHVVAEADDIEVTLHDNRTFKATVVGTDPSTDIAVIRIKADDLPALPFGDSDKVRVGEWVLAVGNPFGLTSTVTAGIVSAKARNINILRDQFAVESFIQTDAAINPGNSGGALVDLAGNLIGINSAIASPTGAYAGYGFAVPANIVKKVVADLIEYGVVQRGVLGVMIRSVDGNFAKEKDLAVTTGAYVDSLLENSAAGDAGIKPGDVIVAVNDQEVKSSPELQELIARHRPGDKVRIKVNRFGKELTFDVTLRNHQGDLGLVSRAQDDVLQVLGVELEAIDKDLARKLDIPGGVRVKKLYPGKIRKYTDMREGFIITRIDGKPVKSVDDVVKALEDKKGGVLIEGVYEDLPGTYYYAFGM